MKKDPNEPTGLQQAMAAVSASENPFEDDGSTDFSEAPSFPLQSRVKSAAVADEPIEPSAPKRRLAPEGAKPVDWTGELVSERGKTHGAFADHARITQSLKKIILLELDAREYRGQPPLTDMQHESIDMILHKIGRIVAGESGFADHWDDIGGYARIAGS